MILTFFHLKSPCRTKNLIGEVEFGVFQQVDRSHLLVGTKENVIASLSPKNGNICSFYYPLLPSLLSSLLSPLLSSLPSSLLSPLLAFLIFSSLSFISTVWRHVMESSNRLIHMEAFGKGTALSLFPSFPLSFPLFLSGINLNFCFPGLLSISGDESRSPTLARLWNIQNGRLFWEESLKPHKSEDHSPLLDTASIFNDKEKFSFLLTSHELTALSLAEGVSWKIEFDLLFFSNIQSS